MPASTYSKTALSLALAAILGTLGCSESVESLVASGDAALAKGDYRTAQIQLKSALQRDGRNARARWLLGEVSLAIEDGASAEKEIRRAGELGVGDDAVIPALAQALLLQGKVDAVLELALPAGSSPRSRGEVMAAQGLAHLAKGDKTRADELTSGALKLAPDSKFATTARARALIGADRFDEAEQLLAGLQKSHPDYGLTWSLTGDIQDLRGDLPNAERAYTTAIEKGPNTFRDRLKRAFVRVRQQNLDGALEDSAQLNKALPNLQPAWYLTGLAHFQKKDFPKAAEALDRSYQLNDDHVPTLILLGWSDLNVGNLGQAIERAGRAVAIGPNVVGARLLMATLQLRQGQPKQAEEMVRPVVAALPDNLAAKSLLIASLQAQGKGAEAATLLEQIAAANPESLDVQTQVGIELLRAKEPEKALAVLERAVDRAPQAPRTNAALVAALLKEKKFDEALTAAKRLFSENPNDIVALRVLGASQAAKGDVATAMSTFRRALEIAPGDALVAVGLADLLVQEDDLDGARRVIEDMLNRHPEDARLLTVLSQISVRQGRAEDAKGLVERAIRQNPAHRPAQLLVAQQALADNSPKRALEVLPTGRDVEDARVLDLRAEANLRLKEYASARDDLERLVALMPAAPKLHFRLASAYAGLGDQDRMDKSLADASRLAPNDPAIGLANARALAMRGKHDEAVKLIGTLGLAETEPVLLDTMLFISERKADNADRQRWAEALYHVQPSARTTLRLAAAQVSNGKQGLAEQTLKDWVGQHPEDDAVTLALVGLYGRAGRPTEAVAVLRPLVAKWPENAVLLNNLAWYLQDSDPVEALVLAEKAHAGARDNAAILDTYAMVLAKNGKFGDALQIIDRAIRSEGKSDYFRLQRIDILARSGDKVKAVEELEALRSAVLPPALQSKADALGRQLRGE